MWVMVWVCMTARNDCYFPKMVIMQCCCDLTVVNVALQNKNWKTFQFESCVCVCVSLSLSLFVCVCWFGILIKPTHLFLLAPSCGYERCLLTPPYTIIDKTAEQVPALPSWSTPHSGLVKAPSFQQQKKGRGNSDSLLAPLCRQFCFKWAK